MTTMFVRHQVADHEAWRRVYDDFAPRQRALGVTSDAVYQSVEDPNDITVTHEFATLEAAQAFVASEDLRSTMHAAGVEGELSIWFTNRG